jgi:hypothetical protein
MTQSFVLGTEIESLNKEVKGVVKPAGNLPLNLKDRNR